MTSTTLEPAYTSTASATLGALTRKEIMRYARHPVFIVGVVLTGLTCIGPPDPRASSLLNVICPAAGIGLFGVIVMASLVRSGDQVAVAAGAVATGQRTRTLSLVGALIVPLLAGLVWLVWAVWAYTHWPAPVNGTPFGGVGDGWAYAQLVALGVVPCLGGPVIGLVIGRWLQIRGAAPIAVVLLVLVTVVMQGLFEPLRYGRLVMPWTYFTGPMGIEGDNNRMLILTGSPQWYAAYLLLLCAAGVLAALLRDDEQPRRGLLIGLGVVVLLAAVCCFLAITTGVQTTMVNPIPSR